MSSYGNLEYEVVDKGEGTMDGSSQGAICEERKEIVKGATMVMYEKEINI